MKTYILASSFAFLTAAMASDNLATKTTITNGIARLDTTEALTNYIRAVTLVTAQISQWDTASQSLKAVLDTPASQGARQLELVQSLLNDVHSVLTNITTLEVGLTKTAELAKVRIIPPKEVLLERLPKQINDTIERKAVESLYEARGCFRQNQIAHDKLAVMRAKHFERATVFILSAGSGTNASSAKVRELIYQSATNEFTATISNRLFLMK